MNNKNGLTFADKNSSSIVLTEKLGGVLYLSFILLKIKRITMEIFGKLTEMLGEVLYLSYILLRIESLRTTMEIEIEIFSRRLHHRRNGGTV